MVSNFKDTTTVTVKPKAYITMLKHVLRFGSNAKSADQYKECMGILIGRNVDGPGAMKDIKNVVVEEAVPISHGGSVEVQFKQEDYGNFSIIDSQYADKNLFSVGWYHSHPGLSCFFSATDIRNQLGFQTSNPSAIGIVWDHERLKNPDDIGFDCYRLDNPKAGTMSDYHKVNVIVESPDSIGMGFYTVELRKLIEDLVAGNPPIMELSEIPDVFGDTVMPGRNSMTSKEPELNVYDLKQKLTANFEGLIDASIGPIFGYLNEWAQGMTKGSIDTNIKMLEILKELKDNISKSIAELQAWFKFQLGENLHSVNVEIYDKFEARGVEVDKLIAALDKVNESLGVSLDQAFDKAMVKVSATVTEKIGKAKEQINASVTGADTIVATIQAQNQTTDKISKQLKDNVGKIQEDTKDLPNTIKSTVEVGLGSVNSQIEDILAQNKDLLSTIKALKMIAERL
jgi:proteasome lid subunit RPN8/RPN11